jgi:integrase
LRISEILGLKWDDFNLDNETLQVYRRYKGRFQAKPKSPKSGEEIPFPPELYEILTAWRTHAQNFPNEEGWIFASAATGRPYWATNMQEDYLRPFGEAHGIVKFGWHTFRHTYKQYLEDCDVLPHVVQRLMRHASYRTTERYGGGLRIEKLRQAQQTMVVEMQSVKEARPKRRWA